jgi:hypothetical protein
MMDGRALHPILMNIMPSASDDDETVVCTDFGGKNAYTRGTLVGRRRERLRLLELFLSILMPLLLMNNSVDLLATAML